MIVLGGVNIRTVVNSLTTGLIYQGETVRTAGGNLISTEDNPKRWAEATLVFLNPADEATVRAACPRGTAVGIEWPDGVSSTGFVEFGTEQWVQSNTGTGLYVTASGVSMYKRIPVRIDEAV
jgi:hypothetical protein